VTPGISSLSGEISVKRTTNIHHVSALLTGQRSGPCSDQYNDHYPCNDPCNGGDGVTSRLTCLWLVLQVEKKCSVRAWEFR